jgi:hypothetical protein
LNAARKLLEDARIITRGSALIEDEVAILVDDADAPKAVALLRQAGFNVLTPAS